MVKASIAADSQLISTPSVNTDSTDSTSPKTSASRGVIFPFGIGRPLVRDITASMSASYHMLSEPAAPAPMAIARIAITASSGLIVTGAAIKPTKAVKTTSDITRGFRSSR